MVEYFFEDLKKIFDKNEVNLIKKAYKYAEIAHKGQKRKSGEPYIVHPLHVAYILVNEFHLYDANAIAAALLHDTIEDTKITYEDIEANFNRDIANLVLGVTDSSNIVFNTKTEEERFNNSNILRNMMSDYRIIYIKLADRFHNMRTLEYQSLEKRISKAEQTMAFYVPMAYGIGANKAARDIEDLCFHFLHEEDSIRIGRMKQDYENEHQSEFELILNNIKKVLLDNNINSKMLMRMKNLAGIYDHVKNGTELTNFPGLVKLRIVVNSKEECFKTAALIKKQYDFDAKTIVNQIYKPRYNGYRGYSIMIFSNGIPINVNICTREMEKTNEYGFAILANRLKEKSVPKIQDIIANGSGFMSTLSELGKYYDDQNVLISQVEKELFGRVKTYTPRGDEIVLPDKATVLDFAYKIHTSIGNNAVGAYVNGNLVSLDFELKENDVVDIVRDNNTIRNVQDASMVVTTRARRMIEKYGKK